MVVLNGIDCLNRLLDEFNKPIDRLHIKDICISCKQSLYLDAKKIFSIRDLVDAVIESPSGLSEEQKFFMLNVSLASPDFKDLKKKVSDYRSYKSEGQHKSIANGCLLFCHPVKDPKKFSFDEEKKLDISRARNTNEKITFNELSEEYFHNYFSAKVENKDNIVISPPDDNIVNTLEKWCISKRMPHEQGSLILSNVDIAKHVDILTASGKSTSLSRNRTNTTSYLVFNCTEDIIFWLVTWNGENEDLKGLLDICALDVEDLIAVYQNELKGSRIRIVGLAITGGSDIQKNNLKCVSCQIFLVSKKIFDDDELFGNWYKAFSGYFKKAEEWNMQTSENYESVFPLFCKKILTLMAYTESLPLPNFYNFSRKVQIEQASRLLYHEQRNILYSPGRYVILKGDYGTGKTKVLTKRIECLLETLAENEIIYYINYDKSSKIHSYMHNVFAKSEIPNIFSKLVIQENQKGSKLSDIVKSIVNDANKNTTPTQYPHIFIDQYDGEHLSEGEASFLTGITEKDTTVSVASVFIVTQAIQNSRFGILKKVRSGSQAYIFDELKNFKVRELSYVMRTTVEISRLAELAREYLKDKKNEYTHFNFHSMEVSSYVSKRESRQILAETVPNTKKELGSNFQNSVAVFDQAVKQVSQSRFTNNGYTRKILFKIESFYSFIGNTGMGHKISEQTLPQIFSPIIFENHVENSISVAAVLNYSVIKKSKFVVIHFEPQVPVVFANALSILKDIYNITTTHDVKKFLSNEKHILITNLFNVRGLEFENVLILVEPKEYHLKQYLPEAISRCMATLNFMLLHGNQKCENANEVIENIVDQWRLQKESVIQCIEVQVCKEEKCRQYYCYQREKKIIGINTNSKDFKRMRKKEYDIPVLDVETEEDFSYQCQKLLETRFKNLYSASKTDNPTSSGTNLPSEYFMTPYSRGTCVIINNTFSDDKKWHRVGTNDDKDRLKKLFEWLHFKVEVKDDMEADEIEEWFKNIDDNIGDDLDCFVCCILTHVGPTDIYGNDKKTIPKKLLRESVKAESCKKLESKSKIFLFETCHKQHAQEVTGYAPPTDMVNGDRDAKAPINGDRDAKADICMVAPTAKDNFGCRDANTGSFFIQTLCNVFEEHADKKSFTDMLFEINKQLSEKEICLNIKYFDDTQCVWQVPDSAMMTSYQQSYFKLEKSFRDHCKIKGFEDCEVPTKRQKIDL